jgi:hypothetical protein
MIGMFFLMTNCQSNQQNTKQMNPNEHKIVVQEVIQAKEYTYLRVKERDKELWLAVNAMQAKPGDIYYYEGGFEMKNFKSKELNRTFDSVIFLDKITTEPDNTNSGTAENPHKSGGPMTKIIKTKVKVDKALGGITIAELFADKIKYEGQTVKVRGEVVKYTPSVMGKNWFHLQDGTDFNGKFDLTVSSDAEVHLDDVVTVEGKIILDKDLGYGYVYEVLMENATIK